MDTKEVIDIYSVPIVYSSIKLDANTLADRIYDILVKGDKITETYQANKHKLKKIALDQYEKDIKNLIWNEKESLYADLRSSYKNEQEALVDLEKAMEILKSKGVYVGGVRSPIGYFMAIPGSYFDWTLQTEYLWS